MAEVINGCGKPSYLYYFGDYDPSGLDITRNVESRIREFAPDAEIHFERVAVTEDQITSMSLPTRPTKKTDSRIKGFEGESVEVDAISPKQLREMVDSCITQHVDDHKLLMMRTVEDHERSLLGELMQSFKEANPDDPAWLGEEDEDRN